jgi:hypothetical protein
VVELSERLNTPISTTELERRWAAVPAAMENDDIDVLLMQNNNDHMGGYAKYFTDLPATNGYPRTVVFPRDDLMSVVGQGPHGMDVIGVSRSGRVVPGIDRMVRREDLAQVAGEIDFLIALVPYEDDTHELIGAEVLQAMKPTAFLINIARGRAASPTPRSIPSSTSRCPATIRSGAWRTSSSRPISAASTTPMSARPCRSLKPTSGSSSMARRSE